MLGSDKMLDHLLFLRSFLDQAEVCDPLIQARGHKNVHTTGHLMGSGAGRESARSKPREYLKVKHHPRWLVRGKNRLHGSYEAHCTRVGICRSIREAGGCPQPGPSCTCHHYMQRYSIQVVVITVPYYL